MKMSNKWIAPTLLVVMSLSFGCARFTGAPPPPNTAKKLVPATIFLFPAGGGCKAKVAPWRIQPKNNEYADWTVIDMCGMVSETNKIRLEWLPASVKCNNGDSPLTGVAEGATHFSVQVDGSCPKDAVYNYVVKLQDGTTLADPELEIGQ
jgi:hypothetical protein